MPDLPDYEKKIIIVTPPGEYPAIVQVDLRKILGTDFITPTIAGCVPSSIENEAIAYDADNDWFKQYIENPAIAYDDVNDRFKVDIEALTVGVIDTTTDLTKVLGSALAHSNPVITRLTSGTAFIDPRDRNWTISESLARSWNLGSSDIPDLLDKAARLVGIVYGSLDKLQQQATTKELLVQISHAGVVKDPTAIRALTSSDIVTVVQATAASLKATVTQEAKDRTVTGTLTQSTKHDSKVYAPAIFDASASGTLKAAVANKVTKLHALAIQAQGTVVVNLNNGSGGASLMEWSFQAREGAVLPLASNPAYWAITSVNTILYVTLSAAVQVTITAIVSSDDAS